MKPLLKLCGNHSENDVRLAFASSAEYIGFVFAKSKRQVMPEQIRTWLQRYEKKHYQQLVALFVNETYEQIAKQIQTLPIDVIQCHGNEAPEVLSEIKEKTKKKVWKAIHHNENSLQKMRSYAHIADAYVIDCKVGNQWGGTGVSFNWEYVPKYMEEGKRQGVPVWIAGGICSKNVEQLLPYRPDGIDVSSGIEKNGRKSWTRITQLEERMKRHV